MQRRVSLPAGALAAFDRLLEDGGAQVSYPGMPTRSSLRVRKTPMYGHRSSIQEEDLEENDEGSTETSSEVVNGVKGSRFKPRKLSMMFTSEKGRKMSGLWSHKRAGRQTKHKSATTRNANITKLYEVTEYVHTIKFVSHMENSSHELWNMYLKILKKEGS